MVATSGKQGRRAKGRAMRRRTVLIQAARLGAAGVAALALELGRPGAARAQSLDRARAQGLVGERRDGYVGVVRPGSGVDGLVADINARRRQEYQRIADETGVPMAVVEQRAAERLIGRLPSGQYYMDAGGSWVRK